MEADLVEALLYTVKKYGVPKARVYISVCGDDAQQGSHVRVDHATALSYASYSNLLAQDFCLQHNHLLSRLPPAHVMTEHLSHNPCRLGHDAALGMGRWLHCMNAWKTHLHDS